MKKNIIKISSILLAVGISIVACKKDETTTTAATTKVEDSTKVKSAMNNDEAMSDASSIAVTTTPTSRMAKKGTTILACGTLTITKFPSPLNSYSFAFTIDFGATPTKCSDGITRAGKFTCSYDKYPVVTGTTQTIEFTDYVSEGQKVSGKRVMTVLEKTSSIFKQQVVITNGVYTDSYGTANFASSMTRSMDKGLATPEVADDEWSFIGTSNGKTVYGDTYKLDVKLDSPIRTKGNCQYVVVSGIFNVTLGTNTGTVDFGDGTCDPYANLSMNGSPSVKFNFAE